MLDNYFVMFALADRLCALRRTAVRALLPVPTLWKPPGLSPSVAGMMNLAGAAVPVVPLARLFGLDSSNHIPLYAHILLLADEPHGLKTALLVDRVQDVVPLGADRIVPVDPDSTLNGCVEAEIDWQGQLVHLLAEERILLAYERERLASLTQAMQLRLDEWPIAS